jgi:small subunit ribosomal protein S2
LSAISIKQLLEAGVHFGHQTSRWNPKMKQFIFGERNGIHIIDLQQTLKLFKDAVDFMVDLGTQGKQVLFVGTKRQALESIEEDSQRCGMHYVTTRWLGGLLTNFGTIQKSIKRYKELESMRDEGFYEKLSKKEVAQLERERKKLDKNLRGIRNMNRLPDALFVIDSDKEAIAVKEASKLGIPVVAVVDSNCDPDQIDFLIPGNDDALRSVKLFTSTMADSILAGRSIWDAKQAEERAVREKAEKEEAAKIAAARDAAKKAKEDAARIAEAAAAARAKAKTEAEAKVKAEAKPAVKAEVKAEAKPAVKAEVKAEAKPAVKAEVKAEAKPEAKAEVKAEAKPAVKAEVKAEAKPAVKAEVKAEAKPAVKAEVKAEAKPAAKAKVKDDVKPAAKAEEKAEKK